MSQILFRQTSPQSRRGRRGWWQECLLAEGNDAWVPTKLGENRTRVAARSSHLDLVPPPLIFLSALPGLPLRPPSPLQPG